MRSARCPTTRLGAAVSGRYWWAASLVGGVLLHVAHTSFATWPLAFVALVPLLTIAGGANRRRAVWAGVLTVAPGVVATSYWLGAISGRTGKLVIGAGGGLSLVLVWSLTGLLAQVLLRRSATRSLLWLPLAVWGLETIRSRAFAFAPFLGPYFVLGQTQVAPGNPVFQVAALVGAGGLSAVVVLGNLILANALGRRRQWTTALLGTALLAVLLVGARHDLRPAVPAGRLRVAVAQADIAETDPSLRTYPNSAPVREVYDTLTRAAVAQGAELVVWPEQAIPFAIRSFMPAREWLSELAAEVGASLVVGAKEVQRGPAGTWLNSNATFLIVPERDDLTSHSKEFSAPLEARSVWSPMRKFRQKWGWHARGAGLGMLLEDAGVRFANPICFEAVLSPAVGEAVRAGARFIAVSGNDAVFASDHGAFLSLRHMMARSVEYRRWICRAANRGHTGFVAPDGRLVSMSPPGKPATGVADIDLRGDLTVFARFGHLGEGLAMVAAGLGLLLAGGGLKLKLPTKRGRDALRDEHFRRGGVVPVYGRGGRSDGGAAADLESGHTG